MQAEREREYYVCVPLRARALLKVSVARHLAPLLSRLSWSEACVVVSLMKTTSLLEWEGGWSEWESVGCIVGCNEVAGKQQQWAHNGEQLSRSLFVPRNIKAKYCEWLLAFARLCAGERASYFLGVSRLLRAPECNLIFYYLPLHPPTRSLL